MLAMFAKKHDSIYKSEDVPAYMRASFLKSYADSHDLSQNELAKKIGVNRSTISHWFSSKRRITNFAWSHICSKIDVLS